MVDICRVHVIDIKVSGLSLEMVRVIGGAWSVQVPVVTSATAEGVERLPEMISYKLKNKKKFSVDSVETTTTLASELIPAESPIIVQLGYVFTHA